jgi:hypothetical protein
MTALKIVAVVVGAFIVLSVLVSAIETVVLPRLGFTRITRVVFAVMHRVLVHKRTERTAQSRVLYAPASLVCLPLVWMLSITVGFGLIFWGLHAGSMPFSMEISGSSLFTLGFSKPDRTGLVWLTFIEATIGLGLVALLISYLPTIYSAYNERVKGILVLRALAGNPPDATTFLVNLNRVQSHQTGTVWTGICSWIIEIEQSHCSFPALCYFPEQANEQSWVASMGTVLDGAALEATLDEHSEGILGSNLALAYGVPALVKIGRAASLPLDPPPNVEDLLAGVDERTADISWTRAAFDEATDALVTGGVIERPGAPDAAWRKFAVIRAAYDRALCGLAGLTEAAPAPRTTDRPATVGRPRLFGQGPVKVVWPAAPPGETRLET